MMAEPIPEILFASVKDAVRWSEEVATLVDIRGCLDGLLRKPGAGRLSRQEAVDIAHTISLISASCRPYKGLAAKAIWAGHDSMRDQTLAIVIGSRLKESSDGADKEPGQLIALGLATIKAKRALELYGDRFPVKRMAHDVGVSREHFTRNIKWKALRYLARIQVESWLSMAENEIGAELEARGWM